MTGAEESYYSDAALAKQQAVAEKEARGEKIPLTDFVGIWQPRHPERELCSVDQVKVGRGYEWYELQCERCREIQKSREVDL